MESCERHTPTVAQDLRGALRRIQQQGYSVWGQAHALANRVDGTVRGEDVPDLCAEQFDDLATLARALEPAIAELCHRIERDLQRALKALGDFNPNGV